MNIPILAYHFYHFFASTDEFDDIDSASSASAAAALAGSSSLHQQLVSRLAKNNKPPEDPNKPPRSIQVKLSVTETDFVVVEDVTSLDSSAVVLKGTVVLKFTYVPNREMNVKCSMEGLELFSCNLSNEDESALSILDPVSVSLELKPSEQRLQHSSKAAPPETIISQVFVVSILGVCACGLTRLGRLTTSYQLTRCVR